METTSEATFTLAANGTFIDDVLEGNFSIAPTIEAFFDGDLLLHPFWVRFRPMIEQIPPWVHYILGIYIAIVGIIGVVGNMLVIYMFVSIKSLRTPSNLFIINLAISDLGFSAVNGFPLMTISSFMGKWYFGKIACELYGFFGGLFGFNSINSLAWISYDRMYVITKPFEAMRKSTMKRSALQLLIVWFWALLWSLPPLVGWGAYIPEGFMTSCSFDYLTRNALNISYVWSMFGGGFVAPVLMIIYCYVNIISAVAKQAKEMNKTAEKMGAKTSKDEKAKKQEIALAKVAAVTIVFFLCSWLPYAFVCMAAIAGYEAILTPYTCVIPVLFAKASAMWNPILYALSHPRFRAALDQMFPALVLCRGLCMDKGDGDAEDSDQGGKKGKGKSNMSRADSSCSQVSEITDVGSSAGINDTKVEMQTNPGQRSGGGGGQAPPRPQPPRNVNSSRPGQLQAQEPRAAPGSAPPSPQPSEGRRRSFRQSIGRAAGEAYKNLIDAYVGLKNVSDKLGDKRTAMTLEENHPASRRSSTVGYENPAYQAGPPSMAALPVPGAPVYSVPVIYQQGAVPLTQMLPQGFTTQTLTVGATPAPPVVAPPAQVAAPLAGAVAPQVPAVSTASPPAPATVVEGGGAPTQASPSTSSPPVAAQPPSQPDPPPAAASSQPPAKDAAASPAAASEPSSGTLSSNPQGSSTPPAGPETPAPAPAPQTTASTPSEKVKAEGTEAAAATKATANPAARDPPLPPPPPPVQTVDDGEV